MVAELSAVQRIERFAGREHDRTIASIFVVVVLFVTVGMCRLWSRILTLRSNMPGSSISLGLGTVELVVAIWACASSKATG